MPRLRRYRSPAAKSPVCATRVDWSRALADGLVAFWALNEGAGPPSDPAAGWAATSNTATWASTAAGWGLAFNGTTQYVNLGAMKALNVAGPITAAMYASPAVSVACNAIDNHNPPTNTAGWMMGYCVNGGNIKEIAWYVGATNTTASSTANAVDGNPHVFAVSQSSTSAGGVQFYRDGVPWGTATQSSFPTANTTNASLGARIDGTTRFLSGSMGWSAVWNRALSATEHWLIGASPTAIFGLIMAGTRPGWQFAHTAAAPPSYMPWIFGDQIEANATG